ncbi:hypothetical protein F5Y09DRAFT_58062 [Xylaria sp. FL1042]|nr:hypothetical protein F5Y09DRAFT_58062 [Xylaria sp. FL1042]
MFKLVNIFHPAEQLRIRHISMPTTRRTTNHMDATMVLAWLTDVCSSSPSPSIGSPPSPSPSSPPPPSRGRYQRRRPLQTRQNRQPQKKRNHFPAAVKTFDPITHQDRAAGMPPRRRSPRKKGIAVEDPADEPLRLDRMSAALDKLDDPPNTHLNPQNDGEGRDCLHRPADRSHDDNVPTTIAPPYAAASTNRTSRSRSLFSHRLSQATFSEPSNTDAPTSLRSAVTGSSRARSQSPIKQANDLMKLDIPVYWRDISLVELHRRLDDRRSAGLLKSINSVLRKGYLPMELRDTLDLELGLDDGDDILYAKTPSLPISESQLRRAKFLAGTMSRSLSASPQQAGGSPDLNKSLSSFNHLQSLLSELEVLGTIVATTQDYSTVPRAEASWNERIHGRMLDLAVSHTPSVGVENVTRANIAKDFLPPTSARHMSLPAGSKLIDYAMVVKPSPTFGDEESDENNDDGSKKLSLERIVYFVDMLDYPSFNQSSYSPLCSMPSGIFIETKVNTQKSTEAKAQLGMWLASWYGRVSEFPNIRDHDNNNNNNNVLPPPVLPILLVEAGSWELYFAFDAGSHYDVCGRVSIGSTHSLDEAYRLLAVLRILAKWMETDFLAWVEECLRRAGV